MRHGEATSAKFKLQSSQLVGGQLGKACKRAGGWVWQSANLLLVVGLRRCTLPDMIILCPGFRAPLQQQLSLQNEVRTSGFGSTDLVRAVAKLQFVQRFGIFKLTLKISVLR